MIEQLGSIGWQRILHILQSGRIVHRQLHTALGWHCHIGIGIASPTDIAAGNSQFVGSDG